jgi:hypothetical protein
VAALGFGRREKGLERRRRRRRHCLGAAAGGVFGRGEGCARVAAAEVAAAVGRGDGRRGTAAQNEKKRGPLRF